jgi:diguanylate cyclase (GGDEF)-like protein
MSRDGRIVHGNTAGRRIWGGARFVPPNQFGEYRGWWLSTGRPIATEEWAAYRAITKGETSIDEEIRIACFDGTSKIILNSAVPLRDADGNINGAIIVNQDITSRKRVEEQLREASAAIDAVNRELERVLEREQFKARTDGLTNLYNRRHFFELTKSLIAVAQRYGTPLSLIMFDIDYFKGINDRLGHQAGDRILTQVAQVAREHTRESDALARYGGEEFVVALPNTRLDDAFVTAEALRERIAAHPDFAAEQATRVTISAGVAEYGHGVETLDQLIQRADEALYAAKHAGRNCTMKSSPTP